MSQSEFVPCDCGMCYFFLTVFTNGIGNKDNKSWVVEYLCVTCIDTTGCTNERVSIIGRSLSY